MAARPPTQPVGFIQMMMSESEPIHEPSVSAPDILMEAVVIITKVHQTHQIKQKIRVWNYPPSRETQSNVNLFVRAQRVFDCVPVENIYKSSNETVDE